MAETRGSCHQNTGFSVLSQHPFIFITELEILSSWRALALLFNLIQKTQPEKLQLVQQYI